MPVAPKPLTAKFVRDVDAPGVYSDGRRAFGLRLVVRPSTDPRAVLGTVRKSWTQRITVNGRARHIGIGPYPLVTLSKARQKALANARDAFEGIDPRTSGVPTFKTATQTVIDAKRSTWRTPTTADEWEACFRTYVFGLLGHVTVDRITSADIVKVLEGPWLSTKTVGPRVADRISAVMQWAVANGYREDDPVPRALLGMPKNRQRTNHHTAISHTDVGSVIELVRHGRSGPAVALCLAFLVLTAARSGEARGARWDEIDFDAAVWTIPASRYKTGRAHRVALSDGAIEVLQQARELADGNMLVFPTAKADVIHRGSLVKALREAGTEATVHGFRSSFRDWCAEHGVARETAEACLGHVTKGVEGAYKRTDLLEARRRVMADWHEYLTTQIDG